MLSKEELSSLLYSMGNKLYARYKPYQRGNRCPSPISKHHLGLPGLPPKRHVTICRQQKKAASSLYSIHSSSPVVVDEVASNAQSNWQRQTVVVVAERGGTAVGKGCFEDVDVLHCKSKWREKPEVFRKRKGG